MHWKMDDLMNKQKTFIKESAGKIPIDEDAVSDLRMGVWLMILVDTNIYWYLEELHIL